MGHVPWRDAAIGGFEAWKEKLREDLRSLEEQGLCGKGKSST